jgi:hypothetical protein
MGRPEVIRVRVSKSKRVQCVCSDSSFVIHHNRREDTRTPVLDSHWLWVVIIDFNCNLSSNKSNHQIQNPLLFVIKTPNTWQYHWLNDSSSSKKNIHKMTLTKKRILFWGAVSSCSLQVKLWLCSLSSFYLLFVCKSTFNKTILILCKPTFHNATFSTAVCFVFPWSFSLLYFLPGHNLIVAFLNRQF